MRWSAKRRVLFVERSRRADLRGKKGNVRERRRVVAIHDVRVVRATGTGDDGRRGEEEEDRTKTSEVVHNSKRQEKELAMAYGNMKKPTTKRAAFKPCASCKSKAACKKMGGCMKKKRK